MSDSGAIRSQPLNVPNGPSLPRAPTLEAQRTAPQSSILRQLRKAIFSYEETLEDTAEQHLRHAILESDVDENGSLKQLLSEYRRLKDRPGYRVGSDLFQGWTFCNGTTGNVTKSQFDVFQLDIEVTFAKFIIAMSEYLLKPCPDGLQLIGLAFEGKVEHEQALFAAGHKLFATLQGRLRSLPSVPPRIVRFLVAKSLKVPKPSFDPSNISTSDDRRKLLVPPSSKVLRGNLDPTQLMDNHIVLTWQMKAPTFTNAFDIYIWDRYKAVPKSRWADIQLSVPKGTEKATLLVVFQDCSSLDCFANFRGGISINQKISSNQTQQWTYTSEVIFSIIATFEVMVSETTEFLQGCSVELERMNPTAGQNTTSDKLKFLMHMEDCRASALNGMIHGILVLDCVQKWIDCQQSTQQLWDAGVPFQDRLKTLRNDLEFFQDHFANIGDKIQEIQKTMREHLDIEHNRRNFLLTILAAVYLPLSFATSFFGMNINTTTSPSEKGFSNYTSSWIDSSPIDLQNSTRALVSTIGTSGTLSYSWKTFGITSACLLLTLPLPLTIGNILRVVARSTAYYAAYWRILAIIPSTAFVYFSILGMPGTDDSADFYFYCGSNSILMLFVICKFNRAYKSKKKRSFWMSIGLLMCICLWADIYVPYFPMMSIVWFYIACALLRQWWMRRKRLRRNTRAHD